jgi:hypothetical protein
VPTIVGSGTDPSLAKQVGTTGEAGAIALTGVAERPRSAAATRAANMAGLLIISLLIWWSSTTLGRLTAPMGEG